MKKNFKTSLTSLVIVLALGVQGIAGVAVTTFSCDQKASLNESYSITCSITGTIVNGIQWTRPDGSQVAACSDATNCGTLVLGYTIATANSSQNVLEIKKIGNLDVGNWTCKDGAGVDKGCEIIVQKTPNFTLTIVPEKDTYSVGDSLEVSVDVQNYYCSKAPSFHLLIDSQKVELDALPSTPSTTLSGTQTKSITVTDEMKGSIKLVLNCRDDTVLVNKTFTIMDPTPATTESPTPTNSTDASSTTDSIPNSSSETSSSPTSVENTTNKTAEASDESPFACESNCVEETRRIYLSVFLPVLILVAIDVVVIVSVVSKDRGQNKRA